jgi:putative YphP/YqiW family bacilliredoxin
MKYPEEIVQPMRQELTELGAEDLRTAADVDRWVADQKGTGMLVINSICGCAAGAARPGVAAALRHRLRPETIATVFAGQDQEATDKARSYIDLPPSSPSVALFKHGKVVDFLPRARIERRTAEEVGKDLAAMFDKHFASA